ncbi:MAG: hypothetical protein AAB426_09355 [Myxococcota bacterium]
MTRAHACALSAAAATLAVACGYSPLYEVERTRVDRSSHTTLFPVASGAHNGADCDLCHGDFDTFAQFTCTHCHEHDEAVITPQHTGIAGYSYGPTTCYTCHPTGVGRLDRTAHLVYFPIDRGAHEGAACSTCHAGGYNTYDCTTCHEHDQAPTDTTHTGITGYAWGPTTCYTCHPTGEGMSRAAHDPLFPIASGRHALDCASCHVSSYASFECIQCHEHVCSQTDPRHSEVQNYSCQSSRCYDCHPRGVAGDP